MTEQLGLTLFNKVAFYIYLASTIFYILGMLQNQKAMTKLGRILLWAGIAAHAASVTVITIAIGRPPFLNLYEYLLSCTLAAAIIYAITEIITKNIALGGFCVPLITVFAFLTQRLPDTEINSSVMPALRSAWRVPHITTAILGYAAFGFAFVLAIMYLIKQYDEERLEQSGDSVKKSFWSSRIPVAKVLDEVTYRMIAFGFLMQTTTVIVGAVWAQVAWGKYWSWDPKETWSLITWLIYATYLHTRTMFGWRGKKSAWVAIIGFAATMFTLVGVSYLLGGLHSYAGK